MTKQYTPRRDGFKQAATARRLIAASTIAQYVLDSTVEILDDDREVIQYGNEFLVRSRKFVTRYYSVTVENGVWSCTADRDSAAYFVRQAQRYLSQVAA